MEQAQEATEAPQRLPADITVTVQVSQLQLKLPADATCRDLRNKMKHDFGCDVKTFFAGSQLIAPDTKLSSNGSQILTTELEPCVRLTVRDEDGRQIEYKMHGDMRIAKMMNKHCQHRSFFQQNVRFHVNEVDLDPEQTAQSLAEGDIIHVVQRYQRSDEEDQKQKKQKIEL